MVWEFGQCLFLYDMWSWGVWGTTVWMWAAIIGDVGIVLGGSALAQSVVGDDGVYGCDGCYGLGHVALLGFAHRPCNVEPLSALRHQPH